MVISVILEKLSPVTLDLHQQVVDHVVGGEDVVEVEVDVLVVDVVLIEHLVKQLRLNILKHQLSLLEAVTCAVLCSFHKCAFYLSVAFCYVFDNCTALYCIALLCIALCFIMV